MQGIASGLQDFYEKNYPNVAKTKQLEIRNAVTEVQAIFKRTTFPEMKLNWQSSRCSSSAPGCWDESQSLPRTLPSALACWPSWQRPQYENPRSLPTWVRSPTSTGCLKVGWAVAAKLVVPSVSDMSVWHSLLGP